MVEDLINEKEKLEFYDGVLERLFKDVKDGIVDITGFIVVYKIDGVVDYTPNFFNTSKKVRTYNYIDKIVKEIDRLKRIIGE